MSAIAASSPTSFPWSAAASTFQLLAEARSHFTKTAEGAHFRLYDPITAQALREYKRWLPTLRNDPTLSHSHEAYKDVFTASFKEGWDLRPELADPLHLTLYALMKGHQKGTHRSRRKTKGLLEETTSLYWSAETRELLNPP